MYINLSESLKKWLSIVNVPVDVFNIDVSDGLNVFAKIGYWLEVILKAVLLILSPLIALYELTWIESVKVP